MEQLFKAIDLDTENVTAALSALKTDSQKGMMGER